MQPRSSLDSLASDVNGPRTGRKVLTLKLAAPWGSA
jgi:hypothetical protein